MSPLVSAPQRGYQDWQRVENWDTGSLWSLAVTNVTANQVSPILDVSRSAYLGGTVSESLSQSRLVLQWFLDAAGTIPVASRSFTLSSTVSQQAQMRVPNLGPFVQLTTVSLTGAAYSPTVQVFGTNRFHPLEFIPGLPVVLSIVTGALAASATNTYVPSDYYAGPVSLNTSCANALTVSLQSLNFAAVWDPVAVWNTAAGANAQQNVIAPPGAWRVQVTNQAASATTVNVHATTSATGSS